jgi:hypothetical protein
MQVRHAMKLALALLALGCGSSDAADTDGSTLLTAKMTILGTSGVPAGSLGGIVFGGDTGDVNLTLSFTGTRWDVISYFIPTDVPSVGDGEGSEIVDGTASIQVNDASTGELIASGTFLPEAAIFVSVDNGNGGIGFGSHGSRPGGATWPNAGMEVAYPYALFRQPSAIDLASSFSTPEPLPAAACPGFNHSPGSPDPNGSGCNAAFTLATSVGDLYLEVDGLNDPRAFGQFSIELP